MPKAYRPGGIANHVRVGSLHGLNMANNAVRAAMRGILSRAGISRIKISHDCSTVLLVLFRLGLPLKLRFKSEQFGEWRIGIRRPLCRPFLPIVEPLAAPGFAFVGLSANRLSRLRGTPLGRKSAAADRRCPDHGFFSANA